MATITYDLVYRDGAGVGAPVAKVKVCDTGADRNNITGQLVGDLAYVKEWRGLFVWEGTGWYHVFDGGGITQDITIDKIRPIIQFKSPTTYGRVGQFVNDRVDISTNAYFNGSGWVKDDTSKAAGLFIVEFDGSLAFWTWKIGGNLTRVGWLTSDGDLNVIKGVTQYNRSIPDGVWQNIPFDSNRFLIWGGSGTWTINGIASENYAVIGKTCLYSIRITDSNLSANSAVAIRIPNGMLASHRAASTGKAYSPALGGWTLISGVTEIGWDIISIYKFGSEYFPASGGFFLDIQIQFGVQ